MTSRADKFSVKTKQKEYFSDFLNNFDKNPVTGFLARVTNEEAIKQSLRNIILTNNGERFYDSGIGSKVNASLFEPMNPITQEDLKFSISEACKLEPRAYVHNIIVNVMADGNAVLISIEFSPINSQEERHALDLIVRRVR